MRFRTRLLIVILGMSVLALAACDNGGSSGSSGGGSADEGGGGYSLASLAGTWSYSYTQKGGFGGYITWDQNGKLTKWLDDDCASGVMATNMTFSVTPQGRVTAAAKARCSNANPATADVMFFDLTFRSPTTMKGLFGDAGDKIGVAFTKQ